MLQYNLVWSIYSAAGPEQSDLSAPVELGGKKRDMLPSKQLHAGSAQPHTGRHTRLRGRNGGVR